jgi:NAD(P)-dependent dehydrogenase (short-subunit alcohol dehydrogenase family)
MTAGSAARTRLRSWTQLVAGELDKITLQGKTALVTGASRGIGRATAAALARAGAHVLVHYGRSALEAGSLVSEIQAKGGDAKAISADLAIPDGAALLTKQVRSIVGDRLDVLVLNAGISKAAPRRLYGRGS